jgi:diadenosine tetraphosphate (Ap4A) HIT family hydrolase
MKFNLFNRDKDGHDQSGSAIQSPIEMSDLKQLPEIEEQVFIETAPSKESKTPAHFTADYQRINMETPNPTVSDNNIGLLYAFLDRNHEAKGYDDALLNPDASHLSQNLDALKNELVRTLNKVKTFYEDFIQETDYHIVSRGRSGMVDIVEELEMKKKIAAGHMVKVKEIEENTEKETGDCKGILISYTRGFNNGLAAISHHNILTRKF